MDDLYARGTVIGNQAVMTSLLKMLISDGALSPLQVTGILHDAAVAVRSVKPDIAQAAQVTIAAIQMGLQGPPRPPSNLP
jgi:hypothetical protein